MSFIVLCVIWALAAANVIVWGWWALLVLDTQPAVREWEEAASAKGWIKGVPGNYWLR